LVYALEQKTKEKKEELKEIWDLASICWNIGYRHMYGDGTNYQSSPLERENVR
jgi:hypothetical protein